MRTGMFWKRYKNFGRTTILTKLTRTTKDNGRPARLSKSSLHLSRIDENLNPSVVHLKGK